MLDQVEALVSSVDPSGISSARALKPERMELYRLAVLLRLAGNHEVFPGSFCQQMTNAVESGDIMEFDLDKLAAG